jgi:hypothetical protein
MSEQTTGKQPRQLLSPVPQIGSRGFGFIVEGRERVGEALSGRGSRRVEGGLALVHRALAGISADRGRVFGGRRHLLLDPGNRGQVFLVLGRPLLLRAVDPPAAFVDHIADRADQKAVDDPQGHPEADHDEDQG